MFLYTWPLKSDIPC